MSAVRCVEDASVAVKLYLAEPLAAEAHALFSCLADPASVFHVPDLFFIEVANILWKQVKRGNASLAQVASHIAALTSLPFQTTSTMDLAADALTIAVNHNVTAYDACYVALAARLAVQHITADDQLVNKLAGLPFQVTALAAWTPPP